MSAHTMTMGTMAVMRHWSVVAAGDNFILAIKHLPAGLGSDRSGDGQGSAPPSSSGTSSSGATAGLPPAEVGAAHVPGVLSEVYLGEHPPSSKSWIKRGTKSFLPLH